MAVNGPVAVLFDDEEYKAPGSSPQWSIGTLDEAHADFTGFECMPQRPYQFKSLSLSLRLSAGAGRAGQSPRRDSQALCLTSSGQVLVFLGVSWVFQ